MTFSCCDGSSSQPAHKAASMQVFTFHRCSQDSKSLHPSSGVRHHRGDDQIEEDVGTSGAVRWTSGNWKGSADSTLKERRSSELQTAGWGWRVFRPEGDRYNFENLRRKRDFANVRVVVHVALDLTLTPDNTKMFDCGADFRRRWHWQRRRSSETKCPSARWLEAKSSLQKSKRQRC